MVLCSLFILSLQVILINGNYGEEANKYMVYSAQKISEKGDWKWGYDVLSGMNHQQKAVACALADSRLQKRTLILPSYFGMDVGVEGQDERWISPDLLLNLDKLKLDGYKVTNLLSFKNNISRSEIKIHEWISPNLNDETASSSMIISRLLQPPSAACRYTCDCCTFSICENAPKTSKLYELYSHLKYQFMIGNYDSSQVNSIVKTAQSILGNYSSVHVRRGDKLLNPKQFPNLDALTQPNKVLKVLKQNNIIKGSTIFIASDEKDDFFKELTKKDYNYNIMTLNVLKQKNQYFNSLFNVNNSLCFDKNYKKYLHSSSSNKLRGKEHVFYVEKKERAMKQNHHPSSSPCPPIDTLADYALFIKATSGYVIDTYCDTPGITASLTTLKRSGV
mmetsp:Transcript_11214/g.14497  ORF Transcript_11214/g.14497 Transcript_11214/m.14497 type:complete len:391 (-) Transcript_11214:269-1441(-)